MTVHSDRKGAGDGESTRHRLLPRSSRRLAHHCSAVSSCLRLSRLTHSLACFSRLGTRVPRGPFALRSRIWCKSDFARQTALFGVFFGILKIFWAGSLKNWLFYWIIVRIQWKSGKNPLKMRKFSKKSEK